MGIRIAESGADPHALKLNEGYAFVRGVNNPEERTGEIQVEIVPNLHELGKHAVHLVAATTGSGWAPEIHEIDGKYGVYYADVDPEYGTHAMYVALSETDSPLPPYANPVRLSHEGEWAIDGTKFEHNGQSYFIWSGWPEDKDPDTQQNLYISRMKSATELEPGRTCISTPDNDWEQRERPINEGPSALELDGEVYVTFAASASWKDGYCTGVLKLTGDDPMDKNSWQKQPKPLLDTNGDEIAPGHCSFTKDDYGNTIILYHTARHPDSGWDREVRMAYVMHDEDGNLVVRDTPQYQIAA